MPNVADIDFVRKNCYPVFAVRDAVSGTFGSLLVESNEAVARRNFSFGCRDGLMDYAREDFGLYKIGDFCVDSGVFTPISIPELICKASDFVD